MKKILGISMFSLALLAALPAFAQTTTTNPTTAVVTAISCVGTAVNAREAAIDTAINTHANSLNAAYTTRAAALQKAYTDSTKVQLNKDVKASWSAFNKSVKAANAVWRTDRNNTWSQFRTAAKVCKAPAGLSDSANFASEVVGQ